MSVTEFKYASRTVASVQDASKPSKFCLRRNMPMLRYTMLCYHFWPKYAVEPFYIFYQLPNMLSPISYFS
jgi:hypothetical protein